MGSNKLEPSSKGSLYSFSLVSVSSGGHCGVEQWQSLTDTLDGTECRGTGSLSSRLAGVWQRQLSRAHAYHLGRWLKRDPSPGRAWDNDRVDTGESTALPMNNFPRKSPLGCVGSLISGGLPNPLLPDEAMASSPAGPVCVRAQTRPAKLRPTAPHSSHRTSTADAVHGCVDHYFQLTQNSHCSLFSASLMSPGTGLEGVPKDRLQDTSGEGGTERAPDHPKSRHAIKHRSFSSLLSREAFPIKSPLAPCREAQLPLKASAHLLATQELSASERTKLLGALHNAPARMLFSSSHGAESPSTHCCFTGKSGHGAEICSLCSPGHNSPSEPTGSKHSLKPSLSCVLCRVAKGKGGSINTEHAFSVLIQELSEKRWKFMDLQTCRKQKPAPFYCCCRP